MTMSILGPEHMSDADELIANHKSSNPLRSSRVRPSPIRFKSAESPVFTAGFTGSKAPSRVRLQFQPILLRGSRVHGSGTPKPWTGYITAGAAAGLRKVAQGCAILTPAREKISNAGNR